MCLMFLFCLQCQFPISKLFNTKNSKPFLNYYPDYLNYHYQTLFVVFSCCSVPTNITVNVQGFSLFPSKCTLPVHVHSAYIILAHSHTPACLLKHAVVITHVHRQTHVVHTQIQVDASRGTHIHINLVSASIAKSKQVSLF